MPLLPMNRMCSRRRHKKPFNEDSTMPSASDALEAFADPGAHGYFAVVDESGTSAQLSLLYVAAEQHNPGIEEHFPEVAVWEQKRRIWIGGTSSSTTRSIRNLTHRLTVIARTAREATLPSSTASLTTSSDSRSGAVRPPDTRQPALTRRCASAGWCVRTA